MFFDEDDDPNAPDLTLLKGSGKTNTWEWELVVDGEVHNFATHYSRASVFPFFTVATLLAYFALLGASPNRIPTIFFIWCCCAPLLMLAGYCCRKRDPPLIMYQVRQDFGVWPMSVSRDPSHMYT